VGLGALGLGLGAWGVRAEYVGSRFWGAGGASEDGND